MSSANTSVRAAAEACSANAHELVLTHLLAAWAVVPAPEIAAAIEAVSSHAGAERPALTARTQDEATKAWMRRARAKRPADLHHLLAHLVEAPSSELVRRVGWLAAQSPDPRVTASLAKLAATPPFCSPGTMRFWAGVHRLLQTHRDPRTRATLEHALPPRPTGLTRKPTPAQQLLLLRYATIEQLRAQPPVKRSRADATTCRTLCAEICTRLASVPPPVRERLFAEVFAHPHDDERRRVLADYLLERGDPRGEFIALQVMGELGPHQRRRERELLREHGRAWLGPLATVLRRDSVVFERGFPTHGRFNSACRNVMHVVGDPHWATIEDLRAPPEIITHPVMRSLRHAICSNEALLVMFTDDVRRPTIETIDAEIGADTDNWLSRLRELGPREVGLPNLRRLELRGSDPRPEAWTWVWRAGGLEQLREIELSLEHCDPRAWIARLQADAPGLDVLMLRTWDFDLMLTHVEPGDWRRARAAAAWLDIDRDAYQPADLRALAATPLLLDRLEIDVRLARRPEFASAVAAGIVDITPDPWGNRAEFASSEGVPPEQDHDADQVA